MASFVNFNNKKEQSLNTYSIRTVKEALFLAETKNPNKIEKLVEGIEGRLTLPEALVLFSDKLNAMSILSHVHANALHVNEGQFSWITYDTDVQIGSERENTIDVYMFDNEGNQWHEKKYEGYGEFGNMDYYELLAKMNGYTEEDLIKKYKGKDMREIGIDLAFKKLKTKVKGNKVLFPALVENPKFDWKRHDFTQEAESDPNQSWYQEPEYDDYEDDDDYEQGWYESFMTEAQRVNEWGSSDQSTFLDSMHRDAGKPKKMPSPFDSKLRQAAEDAVDFYWDEWPEYKSDRDGLVDNAVRSYLRRYFKKDFEMMARMFEVTEHHSENPNDKYEVRHCDKPETPYGVWEGDTLVKCFELEEDAFAFAKEQNKEQGLTEKFSFSKKEVEAAASLIASAIAQADKVKTKVHHLEYDKGRGAGFDISIDGEESAGGSYVVKDNGDVVNAAIGNSQPNAVYSTIGNKSIDDVFTNMKKYESVVTEASFDSEELYSEIEKDRKTKMISDVEDGSILFYHKDIVKGKAEVNVDSFSGDITIEVPGGPYGSGEWYGDQVSNMKDIDKQIKSYIKAEKSGEFEAMEESLSEAASNFKVLLRTSKDESIGRKIRLGDKKDPGHEVWEKIDKNHWMNLQTEEKLDLSEWAKRADEFNMADQDLQFENLSESDKVNEAFSRMSKDVIENELFAASQALTTYYDWLKAGNDSGKGESIDHVISLLKKCKKNIKRFNNKEEVEGTLYEAKFVKEFDEAVLDATTKEEVLELYPNAEFFIGSSNHFFGELDENLFFKAYYTKGQKEFKIKSVYSEKNKNYVHLYNESLVAEGSSKEFEKALAHYAEIGGHSSNGRRELVDAYWSLLNKKQRDEYFMPLAHAQYAKNNKVGWAKEVTEKTYNKKSLMKAMKADDGMIQLGNGQEYVIYAYGNGNDHNDDMWRDKTIFALDQDGEEHEIEYSDIVRYDESYDESKLTWHGLKESLGIATINEKKNDLNLDTIEQYVREVIDGGKSFMDIGKRLKGLYKYDFSTGMMPMYIIPVSGNKIVIINKKYVEKGQADRIVGDIAIGLMESMNERRFGQNSDDALILIQQALRGMKNMKAEIKGDTVIISNKAKDEFTYSLNDGGDVQEFIDELEESIVNEGRSINKISKEFGETVANMKKTVDEWKTSEGDRKAELLEKLRELNKMKANLEKELDEAVSGKDKNITLALGEE